MSTATRLRHPARPRCGRGWSLGLALTAGALALPAAARAPEWFVQTGGVSRHFEPTQAAGQRWREQHPGLGFERRGPGLGDNAFDWQLSSAGGVMQDSRGFWGGYLGLAYQRQWQLRPGADLGVGMGAFAFYRSSSWNGRMALVPALMPTGSVHLPASGVKLNLAYVPPMSAFNRSQPSVLHAQLGFRLP